MFVSVPYETPFVYLEPFSFWFFLVDLHQKSPFFMSTIV